MFAYTRKGVYYKVVGKCTHRMTITYTISSWYMVRLSYINTRWALVYNNSQKRSKQRTMYT